jgi:hypothetical protein
VSYVYDMTGIENTDRKGEGPRKKLAQSKENDKPAAQDSSDTDSEFCPEFEPQDMSTYQKPDNDTALNAQPSGSQAPPPGYSSYPTFYVGRTNDQPSNNANTLPNPVWLQPASTTSHWPTSSTTTAAGSAEFMSRYTPILPKPTAAVAPNPQTSGEQPAEVSNSQPPSTTGKCGV